MVDENRLVIRGTYSPFSSHYLYILQIEFIEWNETSVVYNTGLFNDVRFFSMSACVLLALVASEKF